MGERKVLNKYIPADFDPRLVPRSKRPDGDLVPVRMMLPFSIQCASCHTFMYRGRKFNSKKEPVRGSEGTYLGIQRYRFFIKCTSCSRPVTFLTDPKNTDYEMESGATRNYEVWHDKNRTEKDIEAEKTVQEELNPMAALENRVLDSQREMEALNELEEIRALNLRHTQLMSGTATVDGSGDGGDGGGAFDSVAKSILSASKESKNEQQDHSRRQHKVEDVVLTAEEEAMVKSIKFGSVAANKEPNRRLNEADEIEMDLRRRRRQGDLERQLVQTNRDEKKNKIDVLQPAFSIKFKRKRVQSSEPLSQADGHIPAKTQKTTFPGTDNSVMNLLGDYGSSSDSD